MSGLFPMNKDGQLCIVKISAKDLISVKYQNWEMIFSENWVFGVNGRIKSRIIARS